MHSKTRTLSLGLAAFVLLAAAGVAANAQSGDRREGTDGSARPAVDVTQPILAHPFVRLPSGQSQVSNAGQGLAGAADGTVQVRTLDQQAAPTPLEGGAEAGDPRAALGASWTYQGQLKLSGVPVTGTYDMRFTLLDDASATVAGPLCMNNVQVTAGLFTVELDFSPATPFNTSENRYLKIEVVSDPPGTSACGSAAFTVLSPPQKLTAAPFALGLRVPYSATASASNQGLLSLHNTGFGEGISATSDSFIGIWGRHADNNWAGVFGSTATTGSPTVWANSGVSGYSQNGVGVGAYTETGIGVIAWSTAGTGTTYGVQGRVDSPDGYGGYFIGRGYFSGNVGIGNLNPGQKLDVTGNIKASGTITSGSSITIDGTAGSETVSSTANLNVNVASGRVMRYESNATAPNVIGGYSGNTVTAGAVGATIGGGGGSTLLNSVTDNYGTVGGGRFNRAGDNAGTVSDQYSATVGGGRGNTASSTTSTVGGGDSNTASGWNSTVGGGFANTASGQDSTVGGGFSNAASLNTSTVGGGYNNTASGWDSTVAGGTANTASGTESVVSGGRNNVASGDASTVGGRDNTARGLRSTVPGGYSCEAGGDYSFAAGRQAHVRSTALGDPATDNGTFVWADSTAADYLSTAANQFNVRASGGSRIHSNSTATVGVQLAAGGNSWSAISDRNVKENVTPVDAREVLERLAAIPIGEWNLISQDPSIRHIGPMAQDFHTAFGVGEFETHISTSDADGVALAAIQGLYEIVKDKDCRIDELEGEKAGLEARVAALEAMMSKVLAAHNGGAR